MKVMLLLPRCLILSFLNFSLSAATELINITAESGQDVNLSFRAQNRNTVTFVEWSKYGLKKGYLLLYRDERFDPENQHPSFKNRVELQDRQMKDGDVSLILKKVTFNDTGTYECRVETQVNRRKRANQGDDPIRTIYLRVVAPPPGPTGGDTEDGGSDNIRKHSFVGLPRLVFAVILVFLIYRQHKRKDS